MANKKTAIALMYDFDKTLCTKDMQEYGFISNMGMTSGKFWAETDELMKTAKMDSVLAYMYMMIKKSNQNEKSIHREDFVELGKMAIDYSDGIIEAEQNVNADLLSYASSKGTPILNYSGDNFTEAYQEFYEKILG